MRTLFVLMNSNTAQRSSFLSILEVDVVRLTIAVCNSTGPMFFDLTLTHTFSIAVFAKCTRFENTLVSCFHEAREPV